MIYGKFGIRMKRGGSLGSWVWGVYKLKFCVFRGMEIFKKEVGGFWKGMWKILRGF